MDSSFKQEAAEERSVRNASLASDFAVAAKGALAADDDAEIFNAALAFAQTTPLRSFEMAEVLAVLVHRKSISGTALRGWTRDGAEALGERRERLSQEAVVTTEIQVLSATADWENASVCRELQEWFRILNQEFFGGTLPPSPISVDLAPSGNLGWYRPSRDGLALPHRINLNSLYIISGQALRIAVLAHEMVHMWEEIVDGRHGKGGYHAVRFRTKAEEIGIPTNANGHYCGIAPEGQLARLLRRSGVPIADQVTEARTARDLAPKGASRSRLAKWRCGCTSVWASSGVQVQATCTACEEPFRRSS